MHDIYILTKLAAEIRILAEFKLLYKLHAYIIGKCKFCIKFVS